MKKLISFLGKYLIPIASLIFIIFSLFYFINDLTYKIALLIMYIYLAILIPSSDKHPHQKTIKNFFSPFLITNLLIQIILFILNKNQHFGVSLFCGFLTISYLLILLIVIIKPQIKTTNTPFLENILFISVILLIFCNIPFPPIEETITTEAIIQTSLVFIPSYILFKIWIGPINEVLNNKT